MTDFPKVPEGILGEETTEKTNTELFLSLVGQYFPEAIKDGEVDFTALKEEMGEFPQVSSEHYDFTWAGKQAAKKEAMSDIYGRTLKYKPQDSLNPNTTENIYIEGDNLEALKLLRRNYHGKIKMIYIDPPYNTGNDFVYRDDFSITEEELAKLSGDTIEKERLQKVSKDDARYHTKWLNLMYPRLKIARELLSENGCIFISIDDNEVENLKKICSEVFGQDNFVGMLSVENNPKGRKNSDFISVSSEYCLIYARDKTKSYFVENVPKKSSDMTLDENGRYVHNSGKRVLVGENSFNNPVTVVTSDKNYSVYYREIDYTVILRKEEYDEVDQSLLDAGYVKYYSSHKGKLVENTYTQERFMELFRDKALAFSNGKIYEKNFSDSIRMKSQLVNREYEAIVHGEKKNFSMELTTTGANTYLKELFALSDVPFPASKNTGFLKMLISLFDEKDFYVLDFFSGSSSVADAIMQLNAEDGGIRKFIMVQLPELTWEYNDNGEKLAKKENKVAFQAGYDNICEIGKERIRRATKKIHKDNPEAVFDDGFKVFEVADTNIKWNTADDEEIQKLDETDYGNDKERIDFTKGYTDIDVVYEIMLRQFDIPLSTPVEKLPQVSDRTYIFADAVVVCLEPEITTELIEKLAAIEPTPAKFVLRDSAFNDDIQLKDVSFRRLSALIKNHQTEEERKSKYNNYTVEFI